MFFGGLGLTVGASYEIGATLRMGPGYFPVVISGLLLLVGAVIVFRALWSGSSAVGWGSPRPFILVIAAVLAFALLIEPAGFAGATLALVGLVYVGASQFRLIEFVILYSILLLGAFLLFAEFLQMPLNLLPAGL
jgi:hypothetical protein